MVAKKINVSLFATENRETGIGVTSVEQIEIISATKESRLTRDKVLTQLN